MAAESLAGKAVLITGAAGGLGVEIARAYAAAGCRLVLTSRNAGKLDLLKAKLSGGPAIETVAADLAAPGACEQVAEHAERVTGGIDILVNAAGLFHVATLEEAAAEDFDRIFAVNVGAPFRLARVLAPRMAARGAGRIVNIGSSSSYEGFPRTSLYCASKHALLGLSRALFHEWRDRNVRVFCISPGSIQTPMGHQVPDQEFATFLDPADVAAYVVFATSFRGAIVSEEIRLNRMERKS